MPRVTKFSAERRKKILEALQIGLSRRTAGALAGIDHGTLTRWIEKGRTAEEGTMWAAFYLQVLEAEAEPRARAMAIIYKEMPDRPGVVTPQPHKRPRSSWVRFEARLPNERWQSDVTHWRLKDGTEVDIVNFLDDHSRLAVASRVLATATAPGVLEIFREAGARWGFPAALLTDNGCVYTTWHRGGPNVMQTELLALGIDYRHSRPYHPQTCGKVERFHQTMKAFLAKQPQARSIAELQAQVDRFVAYYNDVRPHRAAGRRAPRVAFEARDRARPSGPRIQVGAGVRVRRDRIDKSGRVTLRHRTRLHHIGVGHAHEGKRVILLVDGLDVRVVSEDGELIRHLTLDPTRDYQRQG